MPVSKIRTIVIPVAGRGARLLPVTKGIRKELLPVGRKPLLLYAVEEATASGADCIVFVTPLNDRSVDQFFSRDEDLERYLEEHGLSEEAAALREMCTTVRFAFVRQERPRGLADAIICAREKTAGEPFGVILPDALILSRRPCIGQLMDCHDRHRGCVIGTRKINRSETTSYGVLVVEPNDGDLDSDVVRVRSLVEKPQPEVAPSLFGIFGRYILEPTIFDAIEQISAQKDEEIELTDALCLYCKDNRVFGCLFEGNHFDTGSWLGYGRAVLECLLADKEIESNLPPRITRCN